MDRLGIERDFSVTPFNIQVRDAVFYFSSRANMERFCDEMTDALSEIKDKLQERFGCSVDVTPLALYIWYRKIEHRGFRIVDVVTGGVMICPHDVVITGKRIMKVKSESL